MPGLDPLSTAPVLIDLHGITIRVRGAEIGPRAP